MGSVVIGVRRSLLGRRVWIVAVVAALLAALALAAGPAGRASAAITQVVLQWEAAYGKAFQIQTSPDGTTWTSIFSTTTGTGGTQTLNITGTGRYVRMFGTARGTA